MGRSRRIPTKLRLGALIAGLLVFGCGRPEPLPNILFILIDTLRTDVLEGNASRLKIHRVNPRYRSEAKA
jgi:hypothetical protein